MKTPMKYNFYTVVIALLMVMGTGAAYAQSETTSDALTPSFGIKGGLNFANLYVDNVQSENNKLGGHIGFFAKWPVSNRVAVQSEILYTNKGSKVSYGNFIQGSGEYRFNLNYVEVPVMLSVNLMPGFSLNAGGYVAYLASANVKDVKSDGTISGVSNLNADNFHRFDYGLVGGASFDIKSVTLGARYNYGLQTVGNPGTLSGDLTQNAKNRVVSIFIGFTL